jgi:hypothetical protein
MFRIAAAVMCLVPTWRRSHLFDGSTAGTGETDRPPASEPSCRLYPTNPAAEGMEGSHARCDCRPHHCASERCAPDKPPVLQSSPTTASASEAVAERRALTSGLTPRRSTGATAAISFFLSYLARAYAELSQLTLGAALARRWRRSKLLRKGCGRLKSIAWAAKSRCCRLNSMLRKRKRTSSVPSPSRANNKQNPGNCAPQ